MKRFDENIADANEAGVQFCLTDTETGLVFLNLAGTTHSDESRTRQVGEAHKAYQSILHLLERLHPSLEQQVTLLERLGLLRTGLVAAGVPLDALELALAWTRPNRH